MSMVNLRAPSLPSIVPTFVERLGGSSSSPAIGGKFAETLIPIDAGNGEDERCRLDLVLAPMHPGGNLHVEIVLESTKKATRIHEPR